MKLGLPGAPHLTYCTNVHPGESWAEVREVLARDVLRVKALVAPTEPFGVGLRLSAAAAETLARPGMVESLREFLDAHGLYVFTLNGFPYGAFHGERVKERVYLPDWLDEERLAYTDRLAALLAALMPDDRGLELREGTVSTVPGAFAPRVREPGGADAIAGMIVRHAATLHRLYEETGRTVALALEPEPACFLETVADTVGFFERHLFAPRAVRRLSALTGLGPGESEALLRAQLGVCFDACHMAVEFEEPGPALDALDRAGVRVLKVQVSAGLQAVVGGDRGEALDALRPFAEAVYLHQVVERRDGRLARYVDLPEALEQAAASAGGPREWRVHFHVPLFEERLGPFRSTQPFVRELLARLAREPRCQHLEVETYTWGVLPEAHRDADLAAGIARELRWVLGELAPPRTARTAR